MTQSQNIADEVRKYCEERGIAPSTLCLKVLNNARFLDRHLRRKVKDDEALVALRQYMSENPASEAGDAA